MAEDDTREKRATTTPRPDHDAGRDDPYATPLGGSGTAGAAPDSYALSSTDASISGQRGHAMTGQGDDASERIDAQNSGTQPRERRAGTAGIQSSTNESSLR